MGKVGLETVICGRGYLEFLENYVDCKISAGDSVLVGGDSYRVLQNSHLTMEDGDTVGTPCSIKIGNQNWEATLRHAEVL